MRRFVLTALLGLALSVPAFAYEVPVYNSNGTLVGTTAGLSLVSDLTAVGIGAGFGGSDIGTFSFATGPLLSGSLMGDGTFGFAGSSFTISINSGIFKGLPQGGILFSGAFTSPVGWGPISGEPGYYTINGILAGNWWNGIHADFGFTEQTYFGTFNSSGGVFTANAGTGFSLINPEPGTMALFGTGLIGIAVIVGKKLKAIGTEQL